MHFLFQLNADRFFFTGKEYLSKLTPLSKRKQKKSKTKGRTKKLLRFPSKLEVLKQRVVKKLFWREVLLFTY